MLRWVLRGSTTAAASATGVIHALIGRRIGKILIADAIRIVVAIALPIGCDAAAVQQVQEQEHLLGVRSRWCHSLSHNLFSANLRTHKQKRTSESHPQRVAQVDTGVW